MIADLDAAQCHSGNPGAAYVAISTTVMAARIMRDLYVELVAGYSSIGAVEDGGGDSPVGWFDVLDIRAPRG